jgi:hypothetical protein
MSDSIKAQARFVPYLQLEYPVDIWVVGEVYEVLLVFLIHVLSGDNLVKVCAGHVTRQASCDFFPLV